MYLNSFPSAELWGQHFWKSLLRQYDLLNNYLSDSRACGLDCSRYCILILLFLDKTHIHKMLIVPNLITNYRYCGLLFHYSLKIQMLQFVTYQKHIRWQLRVVWGLLMLWCFILAKAAVHSHSFYSVWVCVLRLWSPVSVHGLARHGGSYKSGRWAIKFYFVYGYVNTL